MRNAVPSFEVTTSGEIPAARMIKDSILDVAREKKVY